MKEGDLDLIIWNCNTHDIILLLINWPLDTGTKQQAEKVCTMVILEIKCTLGQLSLTKGKNIAFSVNRTNSSRTSMHPTFVL